MNWIGTDPGPYPAVRFASWGGKRPPKPGDHLKVIGRNEMGGPLYGLADEGEDFDAVLYALTDDLLRPLAMTADEYERQQEMLRPKRGGLMSETVDFKAEIAAAKVRLGYQADEPVNAEMVANALPENMRAKFWEHLVDKRISELEAEAGISSTEAR